MRIGICQLYLQVLTAAACEGFGANMNLPFVSRLPSVPRLAHTVSTAGEGVGIGANMNLPTIFTSYHLATAGEGIGANMNLPIITTSSHLATAGEGFDANMNLPTVSTSFSRLRSVKVLMQIGICQLYIEVLKELVPVCVWHLLQEVLTRLRPVKELVLV